MIEFLQGTLGFSYTLAATAVIGVLLFSSYVKIATVLGILRVGFGFDSIPAAFITSGLALSLSYFVIAPVLHSVSPASSSSGVEGLNVSTNQANGLAMDSWEKFLTLNTNPEYLARFSELAARVDASYGTNAAVGSGTNWRVLFPAFLVSELSHAFRIGVLLLLPFLVIDLLAGILLSAIGIEQYSAASLALPLKLLLFISVDGWGLLTTNLLQSYTVGG